MAELTKAGRPRQRAPGAGAPQRLASPVRVSFYLEEDARAAVRQLGGDAAEHYRRAIREYLERRGR